MTALALRAVRPRPPMRFGMGVDLVALTAVLEALEHGCGGDRRLDAAIYEALGWEVACVPITRRRVVWQARSPLSTAPQSLPSPTADLADAKRLVPHRWDWGCGLREAHPHAWVRARTIRDGHDLPVRFEQSRMSEERSLTSAALFAHRHIAMEGEGDA